MKYIFINYQNEVIHTEETKTPDETYRFLLRCGFQVGGYQLAPRPVYPSELAVCDAIASL